MVFGVMTGEAAEAGTKSLGAGDTRTQERVKSLRWQGGRNSIKGQDMRKAQKKKKKKSWLANCSQERWGIGSIKAEAFHAAAD